MRAVVRGRFGTPKINSISVKIVTEPKTVFELKNVISNLKIRKMNDIRLNL